MVSVAPARAALADPVAMLTAASALAWVLVTASALASASATAVTAALAATAEPAEPGGTATTGAGGAGGAGGMWGSNVGDDAYVSGISDASADAILDLAAFNQNIVMGANILGNQVDMTVVGGNFSSSLIGEDDGVGDG